MGSTIELLTPPEAARRIRPARSALTRRGAIRRAPD
jgi:hypothetical protein